MELRLSCINPSMYASLGLQKLAADIIVKMHEYFVENIC